MTEPVVHEVNVRIGRGPGRRAERIAIVAGALLFLALVKPWGSTPTDEYAGRRQLPVADPTERTFFADLPCSGSQWLIEADERWAGQVLRTWVLTDAVEATGPSDPRIRFAVVAAEHILAIGYCPSYWDDARPHASLTIYRLRPASEVVRTVPVRLERSPEAAENVLFGPDLGPGPTGSVVAAPAAWPAGRYVMQINGRDGYQRWLGIDIRNVVLGPRLPSELPS